LHAGAGWHKRVAAGPRRHVSVKPPDHRFAGSAADIARLAGDSMSRTLGQQVVVTAYGAGSSLAALCRAHRRTATLFMGTLSNVTNAAVQSVCFDFVKDFAPMCRSPACRSSSPCIRRSAFQSGTYSQSRSPAN
jgi:hypothetical protein